MGISRRGVLAGTVSGLVGSAASAKGSGQDRPNILWLVSEDNNPYIGAYGDKIAHTPTLDALARKGVLYKNAFSTGPVCATSRFAILTGMYAETCGPAQHHRAVAHLPPELRTYPEYLRQAGYYCSNNFKTDYNCDANPKRIWDESGPKAQWYHRPPGKPFMAVYNYFTTHESQLFFTTPGRVKPEEVRVPAYLPDTPAVRTDIASYYNLIEEMDGQVAQRLQQIEARGAAEDTIVFYYSDNGGVLPRSKHYDYDEGFRTAFILYVPPKWQHLAPAPPATVVETPVSYIDLVPTLLSLAGQPKAANLQGRALIGPSAEKPERWAFGTRDRMDERYDFCRTVCDGRYRLVRNYLRDRPGAVHQAYAWQIKSYQDWERLHIAGKLNPVQDRFFRLRPYEEFYDLKIDPDETRDLIADPAQAARIGAMRQALDAHMHAVNDNGFIPEGAPQEGYHESRNPGAYPFERVAALAALAASCDHRHIAAFRAALADDNGVIRYWGAVGLRFLGAEAAPARADLLRTMRDDTLVNVQIPAAEALARMHEQEAVTHLGAILGTAGLSKPVRLQALDALTYLGPIAMGARPQMQAAAVDKDPDVASAGRYLLALSDGTYTPDADIYPGSGSAQAHFKIPPPPL